MTGPFPSLEPMAPTLRVLDAAQCNWEGPLPAGLTACVGLVHLSLMDNHFDGAIPQSWAAQKELVEINMVRGRTTGDHHSPKVVVQFYSKILFYCILKDHRSQPHLHTSSGAKPADRACTAVIWTKARLATTEC